MTTDAQSLPVTPRPETERTAAQRRARRQGINARRVALAFAVTFGTILTLISVVACSYVAANDGKIMPGVSVNGVSVAGLTREEAEQTLRQQLPSVSSGALTITIGELETTIGYSDVGRDYDMAGTLDQVMAYGRDGNPIEQFVEQLRTMFGASSVEITPAVIYNAGELARRVSEIVSVAQAAPVNATIAFENGDYVLTPASDGRSIDGDALLQAATTAIASGVPESTSIDVPVTTIPADISSEAAQNAIAMAQSVTSSSLSLTAGVDSFTVPPTSLKSWVGLEETSPGVWTLTVDRLAIDAYVATIRAQVDQPAVEAQFKISEGGEFRAVPGQVGQEMDATAATDAIYNALIGRGQGTPTSLVVLPVIATEPEFTTAEAQSMLSRVKVLGAWTTKYIPSPLNAEGLNIRRPTQLIDGTVVQPGRQFSFVGTAGPINEANGYGEGAAIVHGKTKAEGVLGGGLCSNSTTLFNAALRAGFEINKRANHAYYITRYPVGLDATIWISGSTVRDVVFTNDSDYPIVIQGINKKRSITYQIWGVDDGRTVHLADPVVTDEQEAHEWYVYSDTLAPRETKRVEYMADGFDSAVNRIVRDANGNVIHNDTFRSDYRRTDGLILLGRYPGDPVAGTRIPYGPLPPKPGGGGGATPTPGPTSPGGPTAPHAAFTVTEKSMPGKFGFNATSSTGGSLTYSWDFGDGVTLTGTDPTVNHTYSLPDTYTVTLTVTNSAGSDIKQHEVTFTAAPTEPPPPTTSPTVTT